MIITIIRKVLCRGTHKLVWTLRKSVINTDTLQVEYVISSSQRQVRYESMEYYQNSAKQWMDTPTRCIHLGYQYRNANGEWGFN
jgi:hypothetical protein